MGDRDSAFAEAIAKALVVNDYRCPDDLEGVSLKDETFDGLGQLELGVILRVQNRVERSLAQPVMSDVDKLAKILEDQEEKKRKDKDKDTVTVELGPNMHLAGLGKLTADMWPRANTMQALATELAKQKKKGVSTVPFTSIRESQTNIGYITLHKTRVLPGEEPLRVHGRKEIHPRVGRRRAVRGIGRRLRRRQIQRYQRFGPILITV